MRKTVKFGLVGCGLMGREFAGAAARWCHLVPDIPAPEIIAVCDSSATARAWFRERCPGVRFAYEDYRALFLNPEVEAVYVALPHHLHRDAYIAAIESGKHLLGEKPFGIDRAANAAILEAAALRPDVFIRCASEFPYFPAMRRMIEWIDAQRFGRILEVRAGLLHAGDLDLLKPINWKRQARTNGLYGCMGDLGIHTQHVPFRAGFLPRTVYAQLGKYVAERPDGKGGRAASDTWGNAALHCEAEGPDGARFPMTLETKRMSPGNTNTFFLEIDGLSASARFTTEKPNVFSYTHSHGREQAWADLTIGHMPFFPTQTGAVFEFGFSDALLQMWAAFLAELSGMETPFGCFTPEETRLSHALLTAALRSHETGRAEAV